MGSSLTHKQSKNLFPPWAVGKNASSKVKVLWLRSNSVITKTMETKSGDHREITYGMVLKPHKPHKLHYFQIHSLYLGNFRKTLNNLTSTKFIRFSTSFLSRDFLSISHITWQASLNFLIYHKIQDFLIKGQIKDAHFSISTNSCIFPNAIPNMMHFHI